jgi:RNA polymerase sigma factor (sigma-70 family)
MEQTLEDWVELAQKGDQAALEAVLRGIQDRVYGLALRMLWHPADAEDASQEILIKVLTHLSTFRHDSSFLTWVYHIACKHLLTRRKQRAEAKMQTFEQYNALLEEGLTTDVLQEEGERGEDWLFIEEIKIGCTLGMLLCLDREDRIAYILGEIFEVSGEEGGLILSIPAATFRKRLSRARLRLHTFMEETCGLINPAAPCRCARQAAYKASKDRTKAKPLVFAAPLLSQRKHPEIVAGMQELTELDRVAALFRSHPEYQAPRSFVEAVRSLLASGRFRLLVTEERTSVIREEQTR